MAKFVFVSDLHLVPGGVSQGVDTIERLRLVVAHINAHHADAEFCVFAGDLTDSGSAEAYEFLIGQAAQISVPVHFTLGNHDDRAVFGETTGIAPEAATGRYDKVLRCREAHVIVLDSLESGAVEGRLTEAQYGWLAARLAEAAGAPVIVVLHHSVVDLGVPTDFINLQGKERFADMLRGHGGVQQVITGHVHMSTAGVYRGVPFTTIAGSHYNIYPTLTGPLNDVKRLDGPGQIGVVLVREDTVVVHHENFVDGNRALPQELFYWDRGAVER